jgi:methyl-accepting chemotaxis protein
MSSFLNAQSSEIAKTQDNTASRVETLLESMEESAKAIKSSTDQIKSGFDELEEARIREEEKKKGLSFFRRKKI